ncbi:MAG: hypothetical protein A3K06_00510 [Candidatus Doudnabacteria bacterium RIFCSPHIGHO2_01_52_17]|uniref:HAD family phosphatase n=1 Tax=Candidatus Doudnabacteria bacterium RIFCSPHIGHO2_01_52_17 TaxID=1817820 RepID=A0A1F5NEX0_9BACT|nr:MAG: HAD-superfamily hydrolase, subfamily IA, variant 3 [Parcubacteria group bacterium GW2011_GWA2_52_8]OGE76092.1 MAG: hypothetical protein A3K06_00510 [Candidatus Doudnabacteria bacterium RIFCSPHIGHO2_01_52_17]
MRYKGIIFDFNGVLLWDEKWHKRAWNEVAKRLLGREIGEQEFKELRGRTNKDWFEYLFKRRPQRPELQNLIDEKEQKYRDIAIRQKDFRLSPGAEQLLFLLKKSDVPMTIATSSEIGNVKFFFEHLGLENWFPLDKEVFDNGTFRGKPAPDIYLLAAKKIGLPPEECIVVEDAKSGISAARSAGIGKIIAFAHDGNESELQALPEVKKVIQNLGEITLEDFE